MSIQVWTKNTFSWNSNEPCLCGRVMCDHSDHILKPQICIMWALSTGMAYWGLVFIVKHHKERDVHNRLWDSKRDGMKYPVNFTVRVPHAEYFWRRSQKLFESDLLFCVKEINEIRTHYPKGMFVLIQPRWLKKPKKTYRHTVLPSSGKWGIKARVQTY